MGCRRPCIRGMRCTGWQHTRADVPPPVVRERTAHCLEVPGPGHVSRHAAAQGSSKPSPAGASRRRGRATGGAPTDKTPPSATPNVLSMPAIPRRLGRRERRPGARSRQSNEPSGLESCAMSNVEVDPTAPHRTAVDRGDSAPQVDVLSARDGPGGRPTSHDGAAHAAAAGPNADLCLVHRRHPPARLRSHGAPSARTTSPTRRGMDVAPHPHTGLKTVGWPCARQSWATSARETTR